MSFSPLNALFNLGLIGLPLCHSTSLPATMCLVISVIDFAYTGKIDINVGNVGQLYLLAHQLGSQSLIDGCWDFIEERFGQINFSEIWMISSILGKHNLREKCIHTIALDFNSFVKDQKCLRWTTAKDMKALLNSPWLWAPSEDLRLEAVVSWINAAPSSCERDTCDAFFTHLLPTLNINKISPSFIIELAMEESNIILSHKSSNGEVKETKPMTQSRSYASAVTVEHEILVFGGYGGNGLLNTCEKYSPSENEWVTLPNMSKGRFRTGAVHVPDLGVLVLGGGATRSGNGLRTVELFQCSANNPTWSSFTPMVKPRLSPAVEFFKECVYVAGSLKTPTQTAEFLSITDGVPCQWTLIPHCDSIGAKPVSMLAVGNHLYVGTVANSVYELETPHEENITNADTSTHTDTTQSMRDSENWKKEGQKEGGNDGRSLVISVIDFAYTGKIDINVGNVGQLYLLAHQLGSQSLIDGCWDFIEERFGQINFSEIWMISSILGKHNLREKCIHTIALDFNSFVKDQKCLRWTTAKDMKALLNSPWLWAPSEDLRLEAVVSWINAAPSSCERDTCDAFFTHLLPTLNINKISPSFIIELAMEESNIILSHKSSNGEVKETKPMTQSRSYASAVTVEHEILVFGGYGGNGLLNTCEKYSPSENEWVTLPNMSKGRFRTGAVHVPDLGVLVLGGGATRSGNGLRTVELFQCSANNPTWSSFTPMVKPRLSPAVEFFKECVYVAGSLKTPTQTAEFLSITDGVPCQWTLIPHCDSIGAKPVSMLAVGNHLYVGTVANSVYELETPHEENEGNPNGYSWRLRFHVPAGCIRRLLKVLMNA
nr:hypothetical transcript [Hymenolepis microstoma]